ncbi:MAG: hypothetical protein ACOYN0_05505 [Phycisphaerales bacterium]
MNVVPLVIALLAAGAGPEVVSTSPTRQPQIVLATRLRVVATEEIEGNAAIGWNQVVTAAAWDADVNTLVDELLSAPWEKFDSGKASECLSTNYDTLASFVTLAARRDSCDWESPFRQQGLGVLMPELGRQRTLAKLLRLRARMALHQGDTRGALEAVRNGFELAQDLGRGKTFVQTLVGASIGRAMLDEVAVIQSRPGAPSLYWALADLPRPYFPMSRVNLYEEAMLDFTLPSLREVESLSLDDDRAVALSAKAVKDLAAMMGPSGGGGAEGDLASAARVIAQYPGARAWMIGAGTSAQRVDALPVSYVVVRHQLAEFRRKSDEVYRWVTLPYYEAEPGLLALLAERARKPDADSSLASWVPNVDRMVAALWGFERRLALLRLVEALRLHHDQTGALPATLGEIVVVPVPRDPITGEAFGYRIEAGCAVISGPAIKLAPDPEVLEYRVRVEE